MKKLKCAVCGGTGEKVCSGCNGEHGSCARCKGKGKIVCLACDGVIYQEPEMQVVEIHPDCKYVLVTDRPLSHEGLSMAKQRIDAWLQSNYPFLIAWGCKLVKVKDNEPL